MSRSQILSDVLRVVSHPRFAEATFKHSCAIERRSNRMTFTIEINGGVEQERPLWWRQLLMRYIRHVTQCEGSAFICDGNQLASTALVGADKLLLEALEREMEAEGVWPKDANQLDIVLSTL